MRRPNYSADHVLPHEGREREGCAHPVSHRIGDSNEWRCEHCRAILIGNVDAAPLDESGDPSPVPILRIVEPPKRRRFLRRIP